MWAGVWWRVHWQIRALSILTLTAPECGCVLCTVTRLTRTSALYTCCPAAESTVMRGHRHDLMRKYWEYDIHNDIFSAFSNGALMNCCAGHQIRVNFSNWDELYFAITLLVERAAAVILCCLNCEAHLESLCILYYTPCRSWISTIYMKISYVDTSWWGAKLMVTSL